MATMKKTIKKPAKSKAGKTSMRDRIYTSFDQVTDAFNEARDELIKLGILWNGSKLDTVECYYEPIPKTGSSTSYPHTPPPPPARTSPIPSCST